MNKLLDLLAEIEAEAEWSIYDGNDNEKIMGLIHQAMDIAVQGKSHKWPEEKPEDDELYLVRLKFEDGDTMNDTLCYNTKAGRWDGMSSLVTHWWNLPEVTE